MSPICQFNMYQNMCTGRDFSDETLLHEEPKQI